MNILIVSATFGEIAPLSASLGFKSEKNPGTRRASFNGLSIDILITGAGMPSAAFWLGKTLSNNS